MDEKYRENMDSLRRLSIELPHGGTTPLDSVATIEVNSGPNTINHEKVRRRIVVQCNVENRGLVDVVEEIRSRQRPIVESLPLGYFVEYGGQFESQQSASRTISILFVASMLGVFFVLYALFGSVNFSLQVMTAIASAMPTASNILQASCRDRLAMRFDSRPRPVIDMHPRSAVTAADSRTRASPRLFRYHAPPERSTGRGASPGSIRSLEMEHAARTAHDDDALLAGRLLRTDVFPRR